jgi:translocation and assembly module TamB
LAAKKYFVKFLRIIGWLTFSVIFLLILFILVIQIPAVQRQIVQKSVGYAEGKIGTTVRLQELYLRFPKEIVLKGLFVEDQSTDTLLFANEISISTDLWALLHHQVQLNSVGLKGVVANIHRVGKDSAFNFDYIVKAFAGGSRVNNDTTQAPWEISFSKLDIEATKFDFDDPVEGNKIHATLGKLNLRMNDFDLAKNVYRVKELTLDNSSATIIQSKLSESPDSPGTNNPSSVLLTWGVERINLHNVRLNYSQQASGQLLYVNLDDALLDVNKIDLKNREIDFEKFSLEHSLVSYQQMPVSSHEKRNEPIVYTKGTPATAETPWHVKLKLLSLKGNSLQFHDFNQPLKHDEVDFNHLWVSGLETEATNITWHGEEFAGVLKNLSFHEKNGFAVREAKGNFNLTAGEARVQDFLLHTNKSTLSINGNANFGSFSNLTNNYPRALVDIRFTRSYVSLEELLYFYPSLAEKIPFTIPLKTVLKIDATIKGHINDLTIDHLAVQGLTATSLDVSGQIKGIPDMRHAVFKIKLEKLFTTKSDLFSVLPDSLRPKSIEIPDSLELSGDYLGTLRKSTINALIKSNFGRVSGSGKINLDTTITGNYDVEIKATDVQTGKLLCQPKAMGKISLVAKIDGTGFKMQDLDSRVDLTVSEFNYGGYVYQNFKLDGTVKKYFFSGKALFNDKNLDFELKGELDYTGDIPSYVLTVDLRNADLKALHLTDRQLKARGTLDVKIKTTDFKIINGSIAIRKVGIFNGMDLYMVDSLLFASIDQKGKTNIKINSDLIDGSFEGTIHLNSLPEVLRRHFNSYYSLKDTAYDKPVDPQQFKFKLEVKKTELLTKIILPQIKSFEPTPITGEFDSEKKILKIHVDIRKIHYENISAGAFVFDVNSSPKSLDYSVVLNKFSYDSAKIPGLKWQGKVAHDSIRTELLVLDSLQKEKYKMAAVFNSFENDFQFRLIPDQVLMNYEKWTVPDDNYLRFGGKGLRAHDFSISKENEKIQIETKGDSIVSLGFRALDLKNIFNIISGKNAVVEGRLEGDFNLYPHKNNAFNSRIRILDLQIFQKPWGEIELTADRVSDDRFNVTLTAQGESANIKVRGYYVTTEPVSSINVSAEVLKLDASLIEPFTLGQARKMSGQIVGSINITGSVKKPVLHGELTFKDTYFISSYVNSAFSLKNETLTFDGTGLVLNNFKILDDNNNAAIFRGTVKTTDFRNYKLDLNLTTSNFRILNTKETNNKLYYGMVRLNARAKITGSFQEPVVDLKMGFSGDTEFTYVIPPSEKGVMEQKGIVTFVDRRVNKDPFLAGLHLKDTIQNMFKGVDLTAAVDLTDSEKLNIVIDPGSKDKLSVQGHTSLIVKIDPAGNMELSGQYEISRGSYNFSFYKLVKRDFQILKGGTITWAGDPMDATLNLQALYKLETSPLELVTNQLSAVSIAEQNQYKQNLPFLVYLNIRGELNAPEISFMLDMPDASKNAMGGNVYAAITDINTREQDLNKQVFSLLVLRRFMADDPFENQASSSLSTTARSSVSGLMTDQLNRLSQNMKGVQLSFDVKSYDDYTTGAASPQTKLQLGVSKTLLHDKLVVKLSGNVDVEGSNSSQNALTDYIGDLALEYKMTSDGRLRLTGFRNSDYDMIDGELIKTGAGLIYIKDYNTLKELFKANEK